MPACLHMCCAVRAHLPRCHVRTFPAVACLPPHLVSRPPLHLWPRTHYPPPPHDTPPPSTACEFCARAAPPPHPICGGHLHAVVGGWSLVDLLACMAMSNPNHLPYADSLFSCTVSQAPPLTSLIPPALPPRLSLNVPSRLCARPGPGRPPPLQNPSSYAKPCIHPLPLSLPPVDPDPLPSMTMV